MMHRMNNMKVINAQQARIIHHYKNTQKKLLKTNAAIRCNKMCRCKHLTTKYILFKSIHNAQNENMKMKIFVCFLCGIVLHYAVCIQNKYEKKRGSNYTTI
jgi:hypothetical protein